MSRWDQLPLDVSAITDQRFVSSRLRPGHVEDLRGLGVDLVLSRTWSAPPRIRPRSPFRLVRLRTFDLWFLPMPLSILRRAVSEALPVMQAGGQVLVHCRGGRHRSVVMAACILVATGMTADEAMEIIVSRRAIADPHARHMERRIRAFERDCLARTATGQVQGGGSGRCA